MLLFSVPFSNPDKNRSAHGFFVQVGKLILENVIYSPKVFPPSEPQILQAVIPAGELWGYNQKFMPARCNPQGFISGGEGLSMLGTERACYFGTKKGGRRGHGII